MRKTLLFITLLLSVQNLFSQQDSLLKKFKYRIDHYRAVNFYIGGGAQFVKSAPSNINSENSSASGGLGGSYYLLKSTDRILLSLSSSLNTSFYTGHSDNTVSKYKSKNFSALPSISILNKWFSKKLFTELGADASLYYYTGKDDASNYSGPARNRRADYSITFNTGIGTGRLENITDMQNALWLYKELEGEKVLSRPLTAQEQNDLGRAITSGNNTRVLDGRRRVKFILSTVDKYLQQKGLVIKNDITYFSSLNDILFFAFNTPRLAGTEKYVRLKPALMRWSNDMTENNAINKFKRNANTKSLLLITGFNKYKPANLVHQNNYGASAKLSYYDLDLTDTYFTSGTVTAETKASPTIKKADANLFFEHAIYPNTRTIINFNLQTEGGYQEVNSESSFFGNVSLNGVFNYFISYQTRFTCNLGIAYQKNMYRVNQSLELLPNNFQLYANASLNISL
jgi:hypothetical protein